MSSEPVNMLCIYRVGDGKESEFRRHLDRHWPTLDAAGLAGPQEPTIYRGQSRGGAVCFIELFQWKDADAANLAHQTPEILQVWEPMGALTEGMEFIQIERVQA